MRVARYPASNVPWAAAKTARACTEFERKPRPARRSGCVGTSFSSMRDTCHRKRAQMNRRKYQRHSVGVALLAWLPVLVLSAVGGQVSAGCVAMPFLHDLEVHVRLLVAMPLLLIAALVTEARSCRAAAVHGTRFRSRERCGAVRGRPRVGDPAARLGSCRGACDRILVRGWYPHLAPLRVRRHGDVVRDSVRRGFKADACRNVVCVGEPAVLHRRHDCHRRGGAQERHPRCCRSGCRG